jgi:hypothetical protein
MQANYTFCGKKRAWDARLQQSGGFPSFIKGTTGDATGIKATSIRSIQLAAISSFMM